jgi:hypothetical protein
MREYIVLDAVDSEGFSFNFRVLVGLIHPHDLSRRIAASFRFFRGGSLSNPRRFASWTIC